MPLRLRISTAALFLIVCCAASTGLAQAGANGSAPTAKPVPLHVSILAPPAAFRGDGQWHLCYEIYVNNLSRDSWIVQSVEAKSESGARLSNVAGKDLDGVLFHP